MTKTNYFLDFFHEKFEINDCDPPCSWIDVSVGAPDKNNKGQPRLDEIARVSITFSSFVNVYTSEYEYRQ